MKKVIITGVELDEKIGAVGFDGTNYYSNFETKYNVSYHGTVDVFTSALSGSLVKGKTLEEAIKIANSSEYGLQSSVFTESINEAFDVAQKLEVGTVQVNNKTERGPDHFPFLWVKASGIGTQGIKYSIEAMSRPKATVINLIK